MTLAEHITVNQFGYYPMPYEKEYREFQELVKKNRADLSDLNMQTTALFNQCVGKRTKKKRVRIPARQQFLAKF